MKNDIYVELIKIIKRKSFKVFLILLILITILLTIFNKSEISDEVEYYNKLSKEEYLFDDYDGYLKKYEDYNKLYSDDILKSEYILKNDIEINDKVKSDLDVSNIIVLFLSIYIIILSSSSFGYEYDKETIKLLLLYKRDRTRVVLSKFLSLVIISLLLSNLIYFLNLITTFILNGNLFGMVDLIVVNGNIIEKPLIVLHTCEYLILLIPQILLIAISFLMGLLLKGSTISSSITIFLLLCSSLITELFLGLKLKLIEYTFLPYMDFTIFRDSRALILYNIENDININVNTGLVLIVIYSLIMLIITTYIFKKRELR